MQVSAVINDENQPGAYVEVADNLKCAITGDPITINRKYLSKLKFTFRGMIVQCFNEFPKLKDRTPSLLRRLLISLPYYGFAGREVIFPAAPEALAQWAREKLHGSGYARALEEFRGGARIREKIWAFQQGADGTQPGFLSEYLRKTDTGTYALFSTDGSYPYPGCRAAVVKGSRTVRDGLYLYYITAGTAQRWAEARGMDAYTYKEAFGSVQ